MIDIKIMRMSMMMSGLILCPLITLAQIYTTEINVDESPFISDVSIECLDENIRLTVHLENTSLAAKYTLMNTTPTTNNLPETNTTGIFIIPNLQLLQSALFETNYGFCTDSRTVTFDCTIPLPVSIINVYAHLHSDMEADLVWEIANEQNVKHYIVEKSSTGSSFDQIAILPITPDMSNFKIYKYEDKSLFSGINYYRIRIEDLDGSIYYTKIVSVFSEIGQLISFNIYPNPTLNNLFVEYTNSRAIYLDLSIYNHLGQVVKSISYTNGAIPKIIELSLIGLPAGMYIIKATDQHGTENVSKFFKVI